jgi:hypothetical protein
MPDTCFEKFKINFIFHVSAIRLEHNVDLMVEQTFFMDNEFKVGKDTQRGK